MVIHIISEAADACFLKVHQVARRITLEQLRACEHGRYVDLIVDGFVVILEEFIRYSERRVESSVV